MLNLGYKDNTDGDTVTQDIKVIEKQYDFLSSNEEKRSIILYGGAGSGKSWSVAQHLLLERFYKEQGIGILVCRKTLPALKNSALALILNFLRKYKLPHKYNKSELLITHGDNFILFKSLDDIEKVKSVEGINYVWVEEATEVTKNDYMQLNLRARAFNSNAGKNNHLFLSFNPIDVRSFLKPITENPPDDTAVLHSTYLDNPFLDPFYVTKLEKLIKEDKTYYLIYSKGLWASPGNIIYTNWKITHFWPSNFDDVGYGLDFGFNNPSSLIEIGVKDQVYYLRERLYQTKLTNQMLIGRMETLIPPHHRDRVIMADAAEPDRIEEIWKAGFNVHACSKGKNSIKIGIDRVKRLDLRVLSTSKNLKEEFQGYKWKEDKYGNILEEPVKLGDHAMDAVRYYLGEEQLEPENVIDVGEYDIGTMFDSDSYNELMEVG